MAYYIKDKKVIESLKSVEGMDLITSYLKDLVGQDPMIENRKDVILFQFYCRVSSDGINWKMDNKAKTNTLMLSDNKEICVNPISNQNGENVTQQLRDYIMNISSELRDKKLNKILNKSI